MKSEVVIIGGGIAGISLGARLAKDHQVTVLEAEIQPGYHSSGRSAAVYIEPYINETILDLTRASRDYHLGYGAVPTRALTVAGADDLVDLDAMMARWGGLCPDMQLVDPRILFEAVPIIRPEAVVAVACDPSAMMLDAHTLLEGFRRGLVAGGGRVISNARVDHIERGARWKISYRDQHIEADILVNAAGAWGDDVAQMAGVKAIGLQPLRRTALLVDPGLDFASWPLVHQAGGGLYFKPEAGLLMVSPADEHPSPPVDAQPEELDVAVAIDRFEKMTTVSVKKVYRTWAGLRTFLPARTPAVGFDRNAENFFWLVGHGGFGMQTSPALSELAATRLRRQETL
ncbi:MAG: FAD-binding oxidoreductase [Proteobacteria bacterium]|nr:FAD-binding oxidoreductase [Pseudomonadota bacterium]